MYLGAFFVIGKMHNADFVVGNPLSGRWAPDGHVGQSFKSLQAFRDRLDVLAPHEVNWDPYAKMRKHYPLLDVMFFHGCIVCGDIVELYIPDRVLRQYGYVQTIPEWPLAARVVRGGSSKQTKPVWGALAKYFRTLDSHMLAHDRLGKRAAFPWECAKYYLTLGIVQIPTYMSTILI
ncbi:hypothetical protein ACS0TY_003551 [Phlomoides rotata]